MTQKNWKRGAIVFLLLSVSLAGSLWADEPTDLAGLTQSLNDATGAFTVAIDTFFVLFAGSLVFFMNTGFGLLEAGLNRAKNAVNILAKNFVVFAVASISFYIIGWGLMFGNGNAFLGLEGLFALTGADNSPATGDAYVGAYSSIAWTGIPLEAKFFFQLVFAGTAATIVSGAVAERIKFYTFVVFSLILVGIFYPITGHWIWGGGWLAGLGMWDFAGSTVVHSVGGWAALTGAIILGARKGKYVGGKVNPIPGHNMGLAFAGCFVLWLGWFGFNPGSTMAVGDGALVAHIFNTTNLAAAAGCLGAAITSTIISKKPDFSMILNGCLAGLVAITAPCAWVSLNGAIIIGLVGGILVVVAVPLFDKLKIDDPVGATSVHLVNGIWGTLAVGLFGSPDWGAGGDAAPGLGLFYGGGVGQLLPQIYGILAVGAFTVVGTGIVWFVLKLIMGLRVSEEEESIGLDIGEHGNNAYPDFASVSGQK